MRIRCKASAGTRQPNDLMVIVEPCDTLRIDIDSNLKEEVKHLILAQISTALERLEVSTCHIQVFDCGAMDYAIAARVKTAICRAEKE